MRHCVLVLIAFSVTYAQAPPAAAPGRPQPDPAKIGKLLETGRCAEGLPHVRKLYVRAAPELKRKLGSSGVRCAMKLNQRSEAAALIEALNRDFPNDPDVLYLTVHTYSDLSLRASQALLFSHPDAYQVHQLNAESLEMQERWDDAAHEYRAVLEKNPQLPGIHYRLGRLILSKPPTPTTNEDARRELEKELQVNPSNAGAEFILGELARQAEQWPEAIKHFGLSAKLDESFADAWLGLGRSLLSDGKVADAIPPLEKAARMQPANPAMHFHLANAYRRAGRKADADREYQAHQQTSEKARQTTDNLKKAVGGDPAAKSPE